MALRISLILAILAGLGVIGVSQFVLKPKVEAVIEKRDANKKGWDDAESRYKTTKKKLDETQTKLTATEKNLEETKTQLTATTAKAESEEKRANGLQQNLNQTKAALKTSQDELYRYSSTGLKPEQITALMATEKKLQGDKVALNEEIGVHQKKIKKLEDQLAIFINKEVDPPVPAQANGKVAVVDPKWDFVVLDFGANKELPDRGILLVSRNGELIAKVRVTAVEDRRSIANVMPGWKLKDIMEGDSVFPY
jgi:hypothetical protein